jgi:YidC/Oxa1 family membrane protein insertase
MFTEIIVRPIFNLLVLIYALIPGHNFGLAIIIFTVVIRLLMWPLVKKQLNHAKAMRDLQPEIKKIKQQTKGDRQKESAMLMELYKEREINPFASIGIIFVQLPILFGLYSGLNRVIKDPRQIIDFSYPILHHLPWMKTLQGNIHQFDNTLFSVLDLSRSAIEKNGHTYWPALLVVAGSAIAQFFQSKQLLPNDKEGRSLRSILRDAGRGKSADQQEVNAAVSKTTVLLIPAFIFLFTIRLASALSLYWFVGALVAIIQQRRILGEDETAMEAIGETKPKASIAAPAKLAASETALPPKKPKKSKHPQTRKKRKKR